MYTQSSLRHACFRAKNSSHNSPETKNLIHMVSQLLTPYQTFENFCTEWDVLVSQTGDINIIKPETDIEFIKETCIEKQVRTKYHIDDMGINDRKSNIISIIESRMLVGKMDWYNYLSVWGAVIENGTLNTKLFSESNQVNVTDDMIEASKLSTDNTEFSYTDSSIILEPTLDNSLDLDKFSKLIPSLQ